jgi:hypothetical protein
MFLLNQGIFLNLEFLLNAISRKSSIHNHLPGQQYSYKFPQIQYRIIDKHPALLAINDAIDLVKQVFWKWGN